MALIHLTNDRSVTEHGSFVDDGNVILNAVKEDLINVSHSIQLGVRGGYNSKEESTLFLEQGMKLLSAYEMHKMTLEEICTIIKETVSDLPCIISLDMGFLDPTNAPAVDNPKIGGFTTYDLRTILRDIIPAIQMKSFDLVNLTYMFDSGEITSQAADGILTDVVCSLAKKKMNEVINMSSIYNAGPVYSGIHTLLGLPYDKDAKDADVALYGMPFDISTTNRYRMPFRPGRNPSVWTV